MWVIEVMADQAGWSVRLEGEASLATFPTFDQAERRARWMAVRHAVAGVDAQIRILDAKGYEVGRWMDERFIPALAAAEPIRRAA